MKKQFSSKKKDYTGICVCLISGPDLIFNYIPDKEGGHFRFTCFFREKNLGYTNYVSREEMETLVSRLKVFYKSTENKETSD